MTRAIFKRVITRNGDVLDDLIWQHYGNGGRSDLLAAVLEANLQLVQLPPVLTAGLVIDLPDLPLPAEAPVNRLWS